MARYGSRDSVVRLMSGAFEAAVHFNMRLPELFCGFTRAPGEAPVAYPVACLPQAWSSGSVFMLMQACLGLEIDGFAGEIHVNRPRLPIGIDQLTIRRLGVGAAAVDLSFQRVGDRVVAYLETRHEGLVPLDRAFLIQRVHKSCSAGTHPRSASSKHSSLAPGGRETCRNEMVAEPPRHSHVCRNRT